MCDCPENEMGNYRWRGRRDERKRNKEEERGNRLRGCGGEEKRRKREKENGVGLKMTDGCKQTQTTSTADLSCRK